MRSTGLRIILLCAVASVVGSLASAQDLEPRRWTHLPIDLNVLGGGYSYLEGDIAFDPVLEIDDTVVKNNTVAARYVRTFELFGTSARVDVTLPYRSARWTGTLGGVATSVKREGFGDPRIRLSVSLLGAPALKGKEYAAFRAEHTVNTVVGAALAVKVPLGTYKEDDLLNLGANRFTIRPQLGVLHTRGPWSYELTGSTILVSDNDDFVGGNRLQRDPIYTVQGHVVRTFAPGLWLSAGLAYGWGGESEINGVNKEDTKGDFLAGVSLGVPISPTQGLSFAYVRTRTGQDVGANTDALLVGWSVRF